MNDLLTNRTIQNLHSMVHGMDTMRVELQSYSPYMYDDILADLLKRTEAVEVGESQRAQELKAELVRDIQIAIEQNNERIKRLGQLLQINAKTMGAIGKIATTLTRLTGMMERRYDD